MITRSLMPLIPANGCTACRSVDCDTVILTGTLVDLPGSREVFDLFEDLSGIKFIKAGMPSFVTAAGALLCAMEA